MKDRDEIDAASNFPLLSIQYLYTHAAKKIKLYNVTLKYRMHLERIVRKVISP